MTSSKREIKKFSNGQSLEYDVGVFDDWCIYICNPDGARNPPKDVEIFLRIIELTKNYDPKKIYFDLKEIFVLTNKQIKIPVSDHITRLSKEYGEDHLTVDILYSTLYAMFVAEENREGTKLGKRIKFLAIHQILKEDLAPDIAANFSKKKSSKDISKLCEDRGF
jgi:hypothetical protein